MTASVSYFWMEDGPPRLGSDDLGSYSKERLNVAAQGLFVLFCF
jgi:hypothetical protein